jgi:exonuclease VII small subunit
MAEKLDLRFNQMQQLDEQEKALDRVLAEYEDGIRGGSEQS